MLKIYAKKEVELEIADFILNEFKARVFSNYPIKGKNKKMRKKNIFRFR